ncbi:hypothetical protein SAMN02990966_01364 [Rhodospirillales bacterium URHD0017]|nr:hypothetical protein SAMN02990966_01364 [Rhodospirillales bacterium URHD0017]
MQSVSRARVVFCVVLFALASPAAAWEGDVHYGLTKWLATKAGFKPEQAEQIALGNVGFDRSRITDAVLTTIQAACIGVDETAAGQVHDHHFASEITVRNAPTSREVKRGQVYKSKLLQTAPRIKDYQDPGDLRELGEYLHVFQDTWSHEGVPDVPYLCEPDLAWGHPIKRGGWSCHLADQTFYWHVQGGDVLQMAEETYKILVDRKPGSAEYWSNLKAEIDAFAKARSKWEKDAWFDRQGFADRSFLQETSLPDCMEQGRCPGQYPFERLINSWRQYVELSFRPQPGRDRPPAPPGAVALFRDFAAGMWRRATDEVTQRIEQGLAIVTLSRILRVNGTCPDVYAVLMPIMLGDGFAGGWGARMPREYCEFVARSALKEMSCADATELLRSSRPVRIGPDIGTISERVQGLGLPPYVLETVFDARSESSVGFVRFPHLPRDILMLTARGTTNPRITGVAWVPDQ